MIPERRCKLENTENVWIIKIYMTPQIDLSFFKIFHQMQQEF